LNYDKLKIVPNKNELEHTRHELENAQGMSWQMHKAFANETENLRAKL
jgi:hypothetical protein